MEDKKIPESDWEAIDASERKDHEDKGVSLDLKMASLLQLAW